MIIGYRELELIKSGWLVLNINSNNKLSSKKTVYNMLDRLVVNSDRVRSMTIYMSDWKWNNPNKVKFVKKVKTN